MPIHASAAICTGTSILATSCRILPRGRVEAGSAAELFVSGTRLFRVGLVVLTAKVEPR
jgi:hypothetical protein